MDAQMAARFDGRRGPDACRLASTWLADLLPGEPLRKNRQPSHFMKFAYINL